MDTTKVYMHGFEINIRVETAYQDITVISECLGGDCYGLEELSKKLTPKVVLDIGGHIGAFGLCVKRLWPKCELIAVEPCKESYELYLRNLADNGFTGTVLNKAIGYIPERTKLLCASRTTGGNVLLSEEEIEDYLSIQYRQFEDVVEDVELLTVEELTKDLDVIDLAKWDCEGSEVQAFKKMDKATAAKFRTIVGEYHLWGEGEKVLQASPLDCMAFQEDTQRKFPHLLWAWGTTISRKDNYAKFQAWPKRKDRK